MANIDSIQSPASAGTGRLRIARPGLLVCTLLALCACGQHSGSADVAAGTRHFARVNADGNAVAGSDNAGERTWACVRDEDTGLVWEVKTAQPGLRFRDNTYTWYNPDAHANGGDAGMANGGKCSASACDTLAYMQAVNAARLCGFTDWRLPTPEEVATINDSRVGYPGPTIDRAWFPEAQAGEYWTANAYNFHYTGAWAWSFDYGYDRVDWKKTPKYVRLVRGGAQTQGANAP